MVQGFGPQNQKPIQYPIYMESKTSYYLPRFYGEAQFGKPNKNQLDEGISTTIEFNGSLRPEQVPIQKLFLDQKGWDYIFKCGGWKTVLALSIIYGIKENDSVSS